MTAAMPLLYCPAMRPSLSLPAWLRALLISFALWAVLCAAAAITTYGDAGQHGDTRSFLRMALGWWRGYFVMMLQSYLLYMAYRRFPAWLATPDRIAAGYAVYVVLCWPGAMLGLAAWRTVKQGNALTLANAWQYFTSMYKFEWFVVFVLLTTCFGAVTAGLLWRQRQVQARELVHAKLSLERQRLAALRGQLEPHFMFNTLSAIGAMVQLGDQPLALAGLARLGDLLQYALASSERDWVDMVDEWRFVQDYLDLQHMRFGPRLHVRVQGAHLLEEGIECPPMLLQPLVENALRHDLECHEGTSDIEVAFVAEAGGLLVRVSNPIPLHAAPKAGLGIGLRGTRARLKLAYGKDATLTAGQTDGRFVAELRIPLAAAA
eukprot:gene37878-46744_t